MSGVEARQLSVGWLGVGRGGRGAAREWRRVLGVAHRSLLFERVDLGLERGAQRALRLPCASRSGV